MKLESLIKLSLQARLAGLRAWHLYFTQGQRGRLALEARRVAEERRRLAEFYKRLHALFPLGYSTLWNKKARV